MLATFFTWPTKCGLMSQSGPSFHGDVLRAHRMADEEVLHLAAAVDEDRLRVASQQVLGFLGFQVLHGRTRLARGARAAGGVRRELADSSSAVARQVAAHHDAKIQGPCDSRIQRSAMQPDRTALLTRLLRERILVLDGAMGTLIQQHKLSEADFRGGFHDHTHDLKGDNDLLSLTQARGRARDPRRVSRGRRGHRRDQHVQRDVDRAGRLRHAERRRTRSTTRPRSIARECADAWTARTPDKPRFVAGAMGPTNRTASISPDVNDPGARNVTFDELVATYTEAVAGLCEGGADILLVETIFDTLNAKAALFAIESFFEKRGAAAAAHRVGHDHRRVGPHAVGPDARGVLERGAPREAAGGGPQLRARRGADAAVHRGDRARRRHVRLLLSQRRVAEPDVGDGLRRDAGADRVAARRFREERLRQHRRRMLRHDARAHPRDRGRGRKVPPRTLPQEELPQPDWTSRSPHCVRRHCRPRGRIASGRPFARCPV